MKILLEDLLLGLRWGKERKISNNGAIDIFKKSNKMKQII